MYSGSPLPRYLQLSLIIYVMVLSFLAIYSGDVEIMMSVLFWDILIAVFIIIHHYFTYEENWLE